MKKLRLCLINQTHPAIDPRKCLESNENVPAALTITLDAVSYPIEFGVGEVGAELTRAVQDARWAGRKSAVMVDQSVAEAFGHELSRAFGAAPVLVLPAGESTKALESLGAVWEWLAAQRVDRGGVLWVIGGGVLGDLGGFAAATYLRGIDCVQVPTTLLAMVDSSVGGKTGINLVAGKNLAGAFHHPRAVYVFPAWLRTLPAREFAAGAAEVIKYGLLADAALFAQLEAAPLTPASASLVEVVRRCCELKAGVVQADPRETAAEGGRALLNLGHTFGHAIERVAGYGSYLHGEAVGVGLCAAARLSRDLGLIDGAAVARVDRAVAAHGLPQRLREPLAVSALIDAMSRDKKVRAGRLRFVVLNSLGHAATRDDVPAERAIAVWRELGATG
jgi:3-dehydroquinate synthase